MREADFVDAIGCGQGAAPHPRFDIYRNNVAAALITALAVRYPVTRQLVGEAFFAAMAGQFAAENRPGSAVLIRYGETLPDFIRSFAPAASVPYLADLASLESLWWQAYHAADVSPVAPEVLAAVPPGEWGAMRFDLHPSFGLAASAFAIGSIWLAHHGGSPLARLRTDMPECVLLARPRAEVELRLLDAAGFAFLTRLRNGESLADAALATAADHPQFDLAHGLQGLVGLGIITGVRPCSA